MRTLLSCAVFVLAWTMGAASGQTITSYYPGNISCGTYSLALNKRSPSTVLEYEGERLAPPALSYATWLAGFVSGVNSQRDPNSQIKGMDRNGIAMWVKRYCDDNPTRLLIEAAQLFVAAHSAQK